MPVFLLIAACCAVPLVAGAAIVFKTLRSVPETGISPNTTRTLGERSGKIHGKSQQVERQTK